MQTHPRALDRAKQRASCLLVAIAPLVAVSCKNSNDGGNADNGARMCMATETPVDDASTTVCASPADLAENFGAAGQCATRPATDYEHTLLATDPRRTFALPGGAPLWPACDVTDGREDWVLVGANPPGAGPRTRALDEIRALLDYTLPAPPSNEAFKQARDLYAVDGGIQSRVNRRPDYHFASFPLPSVLDANGQPNQEPNQVCQGTAIPSSCLQACAGPVELRDALLNPAFCLGETSASEETRRVEAARVEAGLLWFFYLSVYSEVHTTRGPAVEDVDSAFGYYTGFTAGITPSVRAGLASYFHALDPVTHERVWQGLRAVRCWRWLAGDQTPNLGAPRGTDSDLRWRYAVNQLDRALLHGMSLIVRDRLTQLARASEPSIRDAHWAFIQTIGRKLYRAAQATSPDGYNAMKAELEKASVAEVDATALAAALSSVFACP